MGAFNYFINLCHSGMKSERFYTGFFYLEFLQLF
jgi:hypothetical protein